MVVVQAREAAQAELQDERGEQAAADHYLTAKTIANRRRVELEAKFRAAVERFGQLEVNG